MRINICNKETEVQKIKMSEYGELLMEKENILVYGQSGSGKTARVVEYAKSIDADLVILNLALEVPETIGGIPYKDTTTKEKVAYFEKLLSRQLSPIFEDNGKPKIIFLDEINQAPTEVLNCLYSICDMNKEARKWAGHPLPLNLQIVAAGNKDDGSDGTVYLNELPTPLHNRFFIFELIPNKKETKAYLKDKYKSKIQNVAQYIDVLLNDNIPPRDADKILETIAFSKNPLLMQAKIGEELTIKLLDIQKKISHTDPAEIFNNCKASYEIFKEDGIVNWRADNYNKNRRGTIRQI